MIREYVYHIICAALLTDIMVMSNLFMYFVGKRMIRSATVMMLACGLWCKLFYIVHEKRALLVGLRSLKYG